MSDSVGTNDWKTVGEPWGRWSAWGWAIICTMKVPQKLRDPCMERSHAQATRLHFHEPSLVALGRFEGPRA